MTNSEAVSLLMSNEYYNRGYKQGASDVLDKIKAEIGQTLLDDACMQEHSVEKCLSIIDKYKAESEASDADSD